MALPANYNRILYKFRPHTINSDSEFLSIKSTDIYTYKKKIKLKLKKEWLIYIRHHGISLFTYLLSTLIFITILIYMVISSDYKLFSYSAKGLAGISVLFIFVISTLTSTIYFLRGFPSSFISFFKYIKEKYSYHINLKRRIDASKDYFEYRDF